MSRPLCNKCRQGTSAGSDSWCVGCSALENIQGDLRARWGSSDLRRAGNEALVDAARQIKVLRSLSLRLVPARAEASEAAPPAREGSKGLSAKALATPPPKEEAPKGSEAEAPPREPDPEESYTYTSAEEEEESEAIKSEHEGDERAVPPPPPKTPPIPPPPVAVKKEVEEVETRHTEGRSSKEKQPRHRKKDKERGGKERTRGRRGGRKHQQVSRRRHDPNVRFHRKRGVSELKRRRDFSGLPPPPPCPR